MSRALSAGWRAALPCVQRPKRLRVVNRLMGSLLVGMGALMAAVR
jgi:threonine/homoserine/homoserine lactone efflux protein